MTRRRAPVAEGGRTTRRYLVSALLVVLIPVWPPGAVATAEVVCDAPLVGPTDDLAAAVDAAPTGALICLSGAFFVERPDQAEVRPAIPRPRGDRRRRGRRHGFRGPHAWLRDGRNRRGDRATRDARLLVARRRVLAGHGGPRFVDRRRDATASAVASRGGPAADRGNLIERNGEAAHVGSGAAGVKVANGERSPSVATSSMRTSATASGATRGAPRSWSPQHRAGVHSAWRLLRPPRPCDPAEHRAGQQLFPPVLGGATLIARRTSLVRTALGQFSRRRHRDEQLVPAGRVLLIRNKRSAATWSPASTSATTAASTTRPSTSSSRERCEGRPDPSLRRVGHRRH